jgi:hypothetical protein
MLLSVLLAIGGPLLQIGIKLIPILYQFKILKTEAEVAEWKRRFAEAMKVADTSRLDPVSARAQYDEAKSAADRMWQDKFGGKK